jgi:CBS domain-containing protein
MKKCSDVMTKDPVCGTPDDLVVDVAQLMLDEDIGPIPIVEDQNGKKLIGIVTDRDLAIKVVAEGRDPKSTKVADVMTRSVITCRADEPVQTALDAMAEHQLRRIPVVDKDERIVGIIAQADVATRIDEPETTAEMVKEISQ